MNDFTKEELQEVKRCVKYMINGVVTPYSSLTLAINKKIQSLINNYCEHLNRQYYDKIDSHECNDCKKVIIP